MENQLITVSSPDSPAAEAYRTLRTNIQFSSVDRKIKTLAITSSGPGEGKSTTAANLAVVLAQNGHKTILVDCDQRKSKIHKIFKISNQVGISDLLVGNIELNDAVKSISIKNLFIMTSGTKPPNPSELLGSKKMYELLEKLKEVFEYIILDTPPILSVTDAQVLAGHSDGCILVVASGETARDSAVKAKELLQKVGAKILGVVLNKLPINQKGHYRYYYNY